MKFSVALIALCVGLPLTGGCSGDSKKTTDASVDDLGVADLPRPVDLPASPDLADPCATDAGVPPTLACSGLYADFATKTLATGVQPYEPGQALWSDGAQKSRFVQIPAGQTIDVTAMGDWVFPVGTKFWKEFQILVGSDEKRIETRMWWKRGSTDWVGVVYRWSDDESSTSRLTGGEQNVDGTSYEVPAENRCVACHKGKTDRPLGFEAVLLAEPTATGLTFAALQSGSLLRATNGNAAVAVSALQIPGTATEKTALGYLHVNCGVLCHKPGGGAPFRLDLDVSSGSTPTNVSDTTAFAAINVVASQPLQGAPDMMATVYRIRPTDPSRSMVHLRMNLRDAPQGSSGQDQMPPLLTHTVDASGVAAIDAWIDAMTTGQGSPYPAPSP